MVKNKPKFEIFISEEYKHFFFLKKMKFEWIYSQKHDQKKQKGLNSE